MGEKSKTVEEERAKITYLEIHHVWFSTLDSTTYVVSTFRKVMYHPSISGFISQMISVMIQLEIISKIGPTTQKIVLLLISFFFFPLNTPNYPLRLIFSPSFR